MRARAGFGLVQVVVGVLLVALVVGAAAYFLSDVFRTKADVAYAGFAKWTPENIAKDPVNYLNFCEAQTQGAIIKLKASEIAIAQKRGQIEHMLAENRNKVTLGRQALAELKTLFRQADTNQAWTAAWRGVALDADQCKRQILKFAGEIKSKDALIVKLDAATQQLKAQVVKVQEARDRAGEQLAQITTSREMLKVQQITDELTQNLLSIRTVIETSVLGVAASEPGTISLDDLAATQATSVDESEFARIMQE